MTCAHKHHRDETATLAFLSAWLLADPWQREVAVAQMKGMEQQEAAVRHDIALFTPAIRTAKGAPEQWGGTAG